jgi:hypothetical protein
MSLSDLIRKKRDSDDIATATVATFATHEAKEAVTVATVASVAVANPLEEKNNCSKCSSSKPQETENEPGSAWCWRVTLPDREIISFNVPMATHSDIRRIYPDALSIIPEDQRVVPS